MRSDIQIVAVHHDVADRSHRHIILQRLPLVAVVERDIHAEFGAGEQQPFDLGILLHRVDVGAHGDARDHVPPRLSAVVRAVDIGLVIGQTMAVHRRIRGLRIEVAGFDLRHLAPRGHRRRSHIVPGLAVVARHVDQAVVGAHPDRGGLERRRSDGVDHAEAVDHRFVDILGGKRVERDRHVRLQACQVGADFFPGAAAVARAEDELIGVVHGFVRQREDLRQRPRFAIQVVLVGRRQLPAQRRRGIEVLIATARAAAIENVAVLRVGDHGIAFAREARGLPVAK